MEQLPPLPPPRPPAMGRTESPELLTGATKKENLEMARLKGEADNARNQNNMALCNQRLGEIERLKKTILDRQS